MTRIFYKVGDTPITENIAVMQWLGNLPKTKRGKNPYTIGSITFPGCVSFNNKQDAILFSLTFGAKIVDKATVRARIVVYRTYSLLAFLLS